jgi:dTDP-4-dehydrorhamnose 3,5-epimerase
MNAPASPDEGARSVSPAIALTDNAAGALVFQSYDRSPTIEGVWHKPLRKHRGENGWFLELGRLTDGSVAELPGGGDFELRQLSASWAEGGRINAFHIHPKQPQNEIWCVLQGQLTVWLVDCRRDSPTAGLRQKVILSGEDPAQLHIPAGVAHGYRSGAGGALLVYCMDQQFDAADPNEGRLPWDHFGAELWEEDRG